jgi:hypothetical protein
LSQLGSLTPVWLKELIRASCIPHMQKALTEMNIQLANVISDFSGATGLAILRDIVREDRDPDRLAMHKNCRIRASRQDVFVSDCSGHKFIASRVERALGCAS